ncbi:MAG: MmcQ/YjbR family DNA-binding protein [Bacteroidales bacterium]
MNIEEIRAYCLGKKGVEESLPFDDSTLVFKVGNKMFALLGLGKKILNLKCEPERAMELRDEYSAITEGYHMSKKHWNSIWVEQGLKSELIIELIEHSYELVVASLPKRIREELATKQSPATKNRLPR